MKKWTCLLTILFILFSVGCSKKEANPEVKGRFVFARDVNSAKRKRLCIARAGKVKDIYNKCGTPTWSPDGEKILAFSNDLYIFDKQGNLEQKILVKYAAIGSIWYPDGESIIYPGYIEKNDKLDWYIVRRYLEDGREDILYKSEQTSYSIRIFEIDISPDGKRIIFTYGEIQGDENYIYIMNIDGTGLKRLYQGGIECSWYPDSKHIYFETNTDRQGKMINNAWGRAYKMNVDTGDLEIVEETIKYAYRGTRVSRDGKYLVYSKPTKEGGSQIMICPIGERREDKEIAVTYSKLKQGRYTQDTNPDWWQEYSEQ